MTVPPRGHTSPPGGQQKPRWCGNTDRGQTSKTLERLAMQANDTRMYRVKAVAEMFDVSVSTIYRAIESGQLDALKIGTGKGSLRVPGCAVEAFREACAEAAYRSYVVGGESAESADQVVEAVA
jgi:excisionase family DNA binding protein